MTGKPVKKNVEEAPKAVDQLKERREKARAITGKSALPVGVQLKALRDNGILVDLDIEGTGIFTRTATFDDIGFVQDGEIDPRYGWVKPGQKYLIPEAPVKKIKSVVARMRQLYNSHTRKVTGFAPYAWMPFTAHPEFVVEWKLLVAAFYDVKAEIIENHSVYVDQIAKQYELIAQAAWKAMAAQNKGKVIVGGEPLDEEEFYSLMIERAIKLVPSVPDIEAKVKADYTTAMVYGAGDFALEQAEAEQITAKTQAEREKAEIENRAALEDLRAKMWATQAEQSERDIKIDAMRAIELERARAQLKETVSPFIEVYQSALSDVTDRAVELLETIQKGGVVRGKIAEKGRGLLNFYSMLMIPELADERMVDALAGLKSLMGEEGTKDDARSVPSITRKLQEIVELQNTVADEIAAGGSKFSQIEV